MTETSTVNADQVCQTNQDCSFSIVGQICLNNKCTFPCSIDNDCTLEGKCMGEKCYWSGKPVPPLLISNSTQNNLDTTNSSEKITDNKPLIIAIVVVVAIVVLFCLIAVLFLVLRRRKLAESSRGLKPLQLNVSSRTSFGKSRKDLREKERERSSKKFQHEDDLIGPEDEGKDDEDLFTPAAGTHRPPQRSQTMYGTSTPSTVELNVDYLVPGQHHFMQQEEYVEMERDDQQPQQPQQQQPPQEQQE